MKSAMRAVGYRQAIDFLSGRMDASAFREAGIAATRQLAKRQMTWLRGMRDALLIDSDTNEVLENLINIMKVHLGIKTSKK